MALLEARWQLCSQLGGRHTGPFRALAQSARLRVPVAGCDARAGAAREAADRAARTAFHATGGVDLFERTAIVIADQAAA